MTVSNSEIFRGFLYCFLGAVFLELIFKFPVWPSYLFLLIGLILFLFDYKRKEIILILFCLIGIFLGWLIGGNELKNIYPREEKTFSGYVYIDRQPEFKDDYQKLVVCPVELTKKENKTNLKPNCKERLLVFSDLQTIYNFGEIVRINCQLQNPENKYSKFNYINFLAKDRIFQICQKAEIKKIFPENANLVGFYRIKTSLYQNIFIFKNILEKQIKSIFSYPESAYLAGLLLGGEDRLPDNIQTDFRRTGTTHTIAVSGFNITVLANFFMILGIVIGFYRPKAFWLAVLGIIFFVLMIGSPNSAVRAAIMGILILWAAKKGRLGDSVQMIILAGAIMIAFSPLILFYDVGFQLSFLASLGIVLVYGPLSEKFNIKNDFLELKSILLVTISAQAGVMGILVYTFETFSPISFLANLIILPIIPLIMLLGFSSVMISFASNFLATLLVIPTQLALNLEIRVIEILAKISWSSIEIRNVGLGFLIFYYIFFLILVWFLNKK
jgi:competence protein ComEC